MFTVVEEDGAMKGTDMADKKNISLTALDSVKRGILCGIIRSLSMYLFSTNADQKVAGKKVLTFLNALRSNKDITDSEADWQYDVYFNNMRGLAVASDPECCSPCCSDAYMSWYTVMSNLVNDTQVYEWAFGEDQMKSLTKEEQDLVAGLREARNAYERARSNFEKYFTQVNRQEIVHILLKYGTTLAQIAPKWFDMVKRSAGIEQPTEK